VDSRLLDIARYKVVKAAKAAGIALKRTFAAEVPPWAWAAMRFLR
jgi:hypothetical protein